MLPYPSIFLKKGKEISVHRRHHWIFSGAIQRTKGEMAEGDLIQVVDVQGKFLATGFYGSGSIAVRIISFKEEAIDGPFWEGKIRSAFGLRKRVGLTDNSQTNVYRLFHGEGDLVPGLIIDYYNGTAVIQAHHIGIHRQIPAIVGALSTVYGESLAAVYDKSSATLHLSETHSSDGLVYGSPTTRRVMEHGHEFEIDWEKGQKTGFFIDQRENRRLLADYSQGKKVLNAFCYSGGFSVYALKAGAKEVQSVDISGSAIEMTERNVRLNAVPSAQHKGIEADVMQYIKEISGDFDVIVLDPPAFAKHIRSRHKAIQAYKRLNATAMKHMPSGGILFTFSCSQVVDQILFNHTVTAAALEANRVIRILHQLTQPADHPINIFHQETAYLKGLVVYVE
jgi:23S rRNA (cytosine1962-C5)-methyltransferase